MAFVSRRMGRVLLFALIVCEVLYLASGALFSRPHSLERYAGDILVQCRDAAYVPGCYDQKIPELMDVLTMEEAFGVVRLVQKKDPQYLNCHVVGHFLAGRETRKDPEKWKEVITRCPATMCNNGCLHGPLLERYKSESLTPQQIAQAKEDIRDVCEPRGTWHPTEVERSMCYHALGHLHMYMTNANLRQSVALCEDVGRKSDGRNYVQTCTEGVFMQVFQGIDPEDFALVKDIAPTKDTIPAFCAPFEGTPEAFDACHREAWPLFRDQVLNPDGFVQFCSYTNNPIGQQKCFAAVMNFITNSLYVDGGGLDPMKEFCAALPSEKLKGTCFGSAARRLMQIDPAYAKQAFTVCEAARLYGVSDACYEDLARFASTSFHPGSAALSTYCQQFPDTWRQRCLQKSW